MSVSDDDSGKWRGESQSGLLRLGRAVVRALKLFLTISSRALITVGLIGFAGLWLLWIFPPHATHVGVDQVYYDWPIQFVFFGDVAVLFVGFVLAVIKNAIWPRAE